MADSDQNKPEQATAYKLEQARKKGTVARGMDLGLLSSLVAFTLYMMGNGAAFGEHLKQVIRQALVLAPQLSGDETSLWAAFALLGHDILYAMVGLIATIFTTVLLLDLLQTGWVFAPGTMSPDFSRLNPLNGFKKVFSFQSLLETFKNVFKIIAYVTVSSIVIRQAISNAGRSNLDAHEVMNMLARYGTRLLLWFIGVATFFAIIDQLLIRRFFAKRMQMSRRDITEEHRHREGEPRIKQRRKQLHRELAKRSQSQSNIKDADLLITNPNHYAVGLSYDHTRMAAPRILAQGAGVFALRLKRLAFMYGVPIVEDKALARLLYFKGRVDMDVPEASFARLAPIYLKLRATKLVEQR